MFNSVESRIEYFSEIFFRSVYVNSVKHYYFLIIKICINIIIRDNTYPTNSSELIPSRSCTVSRMSATLAPTSSSLTSPLEV